LRNTCSIQLVQTGIPFSIQQLSGQLEIIALGDGAIRKIKYYALGSIAFSIQDEGRLVITSEAGVTAPVVIDATGFGGFGDGPTSAFFIEDTRVIFNGIQFKGFTDPAIKGLDSDIEFVNCQFLDNITAGSFEQGCSVILDGGSIQLGNSGTGMILSQSELTASAVNLAVDIGANPGSFFVAERQSGLTLQTHGANTLEENNIQNSTVIAQSSLNSSITVSNDFQSSGQANLTSNSVLQRTVKINPFLGGVIADASSSVVTSLT